MQEPRPMKFVPVNKTVVFCSPIEGNDVLVRTGTISESSFFLHAFLHGYSKDYINMKRDERIRFTRRLKASIYGRLDIDNWEELGDGIISKTPFIDNALEILDNLILFVHGSEKVKGKSTRRVIKKLMKTIEKHSKTS